MEKQNLLWLMAQGVPLCPVPRSGLEGQWCLLVSPTKAVSVETLNAELPVFSMSVEKGSRDAELGSAVSRG